MNRNALRFPIMFSLIFLLPVFVTSADTLEDKVREISIYGKEENLEMEIRMIIDKNGKESERTMEAFVSREGEGSKILLHIVAPAYLNRMKYLSIRDVSGRESRWMKTSQVVRRLSERNYGDSLFGSDFTVEDLSEFSVGSYTYSKGEPTVIHGRPVSVIDASAVNGSGIYSRRRLYVDDASGMLMKTEFFDAADRIVKIYDVPEIQTVSGSPYPLKCVMETVGEESRTTLYFDSITVKDSIPARYFNKGSL